MIFENKNHPAILKEHQNSDTAILMIHGIFGSPNQFSDMSEFFFHKGYTTQTILLPGHGGSTKDFADSRMYMWHGYVKLCVEKLKDKYKKVVLIGHSMGGLLSIDMAANFGVDAIVLIGTPTSINTTPSAVNLRKKITNKDSNLNINEEKLFLYKKPSIDVDIQEYAKAYSVNAPRLWESLSWSKPLLDLVDMCKNVSNLLPNINIPVMICQSKSDDTIGKSSFEELALGLNRTITEIVLLKDSTHSHFTRAERALLITRIENFLERHIK